MHPNKTRTTPYKLDDPVTNLPLIGPKYKEKLANLGINTIKDLIFHYPIRYSDTREIDSIKEIQNKGEGTVRVTVDSIRNAKTRSRKWITTAQLSDHSGRIKATWFNQPFLTKSIKSGEIYLMHGKISTKWGTALINPQYEQLGDELFTTETTHLGKLTPVYPETYGISSKWLRARIKTLKNYIPDLISDFIPADMLKKEKLIPIQKAINTIHFPDNTENIIKAQERLGINELIEIQRKAQKLLNKRKGQKAPRIDVKEDTSIVKKLLSSLEFELTKGQKTAIKEIFESFGHNIPMHRLLNGDVGSGKTIVALTTAVAAYDKGFTTVIMAPTTILAQQHYRTIKKFLNTANIKIPAKLITSDQKDTITEQPQIIIGTHALIYKQTLPENTAFVVVDEQHRFGVRQRRELEKLTSADTAPLPLIPTKHRKKISPHYLTMTATPIPRTLTLVLYGHTNVSVLDELPKNRKPVQTYLVPTKKRKNSYDWIRDKIKEGDQAFIIYPLVDKSDKIEAKAAKDEHKRLQDKVFPNLKLGLIHGQLKEKEKDEVLQQFKEKKYDILIATPVVEVGIDIPNATIMIIENAERFGLAQLHQFRGRIGRGSKQSYCFLFTDSRTEEVLERLTFFSRNNSGFKVAEYDLQRRGPGEVYGLKQSGILKLRFADLSDITKIKKAQRIATMLTL